MGKIPMSGPRMAPSIQTCTMRLQRKYKDTESQSKLTRVLVKPARASSTGSQALFTQPLLQVLSTFPTNALRKRSVHRLLSALSLEVNLILLSWFNDINSIQVYSENYIIFDFILGRRSL